MNSLQQIKLTQYMKNQKETSASIARSISSLNNDLSAALEHQAYARKNPDLTIDADLLLIIGVGVDALLSQYAEVDAKRIDLLGVKDNTMTADQLIAKHSINLTTYSNSLI